MALREWTAGVLEIFFPPSCVACDDVLPTRGFFCEACGHLVEEIPSVHCARCGEPGRFAHETCPRCASSAPAFASAFAPFEHDGSVARAIHRFKYEDHPELARPLGGLLAASAAQFLERTPAVVCPIPLHEKRFR